MVFSNLKTAVKAAIDGTRKRLTPPKPSSLTLYLTRSCNLRCPHCLWLLYRYDFFDNTKMDLAHARRIMDYYRSRFDITTIDIAAQGEVLLYGELPQVLRYAKNIGFTTLGLTTNGILLGNHVNLCLDYLKVLTVSLDGYSPATYGLQRGASEATFRKILDNIRLLVERRKASDHKSVITLNCIIGKFNMEYIIPMIELAESLSVDSMRFGAYHPTDGSHERWQPLYYGDGQVAEYYRTVMSRTDYKVNVTLPSLYGKRDKFHCSQLKSGVAVGINGEFSPCCHIDPHESYGLFSNDPLSFLKGDLALFKKTFLRARSSAELPANCRECPRLSPERIKFSAKNKTWRPPAIVEKMLGAVNQDLVGP